MPTGAGMITAVTRLPVHATARRVWHGLAGSSAGPLAWRLRLSGRSLRQRLARMLGRAAIALGGPDAVEGSTSAVRSSWGHLPRTWQVTPRPRDVNPSWPAPPTIEAPGEAVRSMYDTGSKPLVMDLALLEQLNEEFRGRPVNPHPQKLDQAGREDRAQKRLLAVHHSIDLADKRVLEIGCGAGFEVWLLSHHFGSDAWGVDVVERRGWTTLADERTHFALADIGTDSPFDADSFDRVISFSVLEHVVHPYAVLREIYRILRPGGLAWLSANLHRGPLASHLYRELYMPFPHLLFTDDVIAQFRAKHSGHTAGASWVNRLTWSQYEDYFHAIGFVIHSLKFSETPLDEAYYERFSNVLGRYPRWDLTRDFFHVALEKPVPPS
jgi:SAM-dependent methyltransferase